VSLEKIAGYDRWLTAQPEEPEHIKGCPAGDDAAGIKVFRVCGGRGGVCECYPPTLWGWLCAWWYGPCEIDEEPGECICPSREELKAEAAEMRADLRDER
jgi:hypothetical protein